MISDKQTSASAQSFVEAVRGLEEQLFADQLDQDDTTRMKSHGKYSWLYRPSHHAATGLMRSTDIDHLAEANRRLLSVGAHPAFFERVLVELGIPPENIVLADKDPALSHSAGPIQSAIFDVNDLWPNLGTFDLIIFPESLCICLADRIEKNLPRDVADVQEAQLLTHVLREALNRLRAVGEIRANGPMSHPKVIELMREKLRKEERELDIQYRRFFLTIRPLSTAA